MPTVRFLCDYQVPDYPNVVYGHGHLLQVDDELAASLQSRGKASVDNPAIVSPLVGFSVTPANTRAVVSWTTSLPSQGQVRWGTDASYGNVDGDGGVVDVDHSVTLNNLHPNTTYHLQLVALAASVCVTSDDKVFRTGKFDLINLLPSRS